MNNRNEMGRVFRALGDVHRLKILDMLAAREMNAGEILEAVDVVQSTLSHHMKTLTDAGLVIPRRSGKWTYYALDNKALQEAVAYLLQIPSVSEEGTELSSEKPEQVNPGTPESLAVTEVPARAETAKEPAHIETIGEPVFRETERKPDKKQGKKESKKAGKKEGKKSGKKAKKKK